MPERLLYAFDDPRRPLAGRGAGQRRVECVGESQYQEALSAIAGGKRRESQYIDTNAEVRREPGNPYDPNAIQVLVATRLVAYLPRDQAARYAPVMDRKRIQALACAAQIRGGWKNGADEGEFGIVVWLPWPGKV